jgi:hypothetical protein
VKRAFAARVGHLDHCLRDCAAFLAFADDVAMMLGGVPDDAGSAGNEQATLPSPMSASAAREKVGARGP